MPVVGVPKVFDKKFSFLVQVDFYTSMAFSKCSALECEVAEIKQYEGGALIPNKSPGRLDFKDITLERGATRLDRDSLIWFATVALAPISKEPLFKRTLRIVQLERNGETSKMWMLVGAWPKTFVAGDWDNTVDENVIEKLTLCYDYFVRVF